MHTTLLRALRQSHRYFPEDSATIKIIRRSWLSGLVISHAWATEWDDAYRIA